MFFRHTMAQKEQLYGAVASALSQPQDRLKLVCKGQSLQNENHVAELRDGGAPLEGSAESVDLREVERVAQRRPFPLSSDHLLAMTVPRPPSAQVYQVANAVEVDSDDEAVR